jgi:histidine triad (HIT) family protein
MALSSEQLKQIKEQLLKQLDQLPPQQADSIRQQIQTMNDSEFEEFLIRNKMIRAPEEGDEIETEGSEEGKGGKQECVFCSIIQGKIPSHKLDENKKSIAVLEINPLSKGHSLILSRDHDKLPSSAFILANKIAKRIKSKFKPEEVKIENSQMMGHQVIQIIPLYKDQKLEKKKATEEELILLKDKLKSKPKIKKEKPLKQATPSILPKAPRRIP